MRIRSLVILLLLPIVFFTQSLHYAGVFPTIDHSAGWNERWSYSLYYFAAFPLANVEKPQINNDFGFLLLYSEQAISYSPDAHWSLTGSYVYQRANVVYDNYVDENRIYIQAKYKASLNKVTLVNRVRFDARFITNRVTGETPLTHRARYLIGMDLPIRSKNNKLYFTMYEEAFFSTMANAAPSYEENWAYAAPGIRLNAKNKVEAGLLYITWHIGNRNWFNQYYLQLTWINNLDLRKKTIVQHE